MTAGLQTFAKVRALHDRTNSAGEKAAAAVRMQVLARKAGLTVEEAVSRLDAKPTSPRDLFEGLFNSPEARAAQAERERHHADRRAAALAEYGSEDAVWAETEREIALVQACRAVIVRKPILGGEIDTLMGWTGGGIRNMAPAAREAVSCAYPLPTTVRVAWAELAAWGKLADDRIAFFADYEHGVRIRARIAVLEELLDTLPSAGMADLRARLDWMQHVLDLGCSRDIHEDQACLDALRADIERMGQRLRNQDAAPVQDEQKGYTTWHTPSRIHDPGTGPMPVQNGHYPDLDDGPKSRPVSPVQSGHPRRPTRAERNAAIHALLAAGRTDREIARRLGISPSTVGAVRRDPEKYPAP